MSALHNSEAAFRRRAKELGLEELFEIFTRRGWDTYANFTFATS
jgi:hypothetical protein